MQTLSEENQRAADLHWLAFLLTGRRQISVDLAIEVLTSHDPERPYFANWMVAWSRRMVIAKALAAVRDDLAASARPAELKRAAKLSLPARNWVLDDGATKAELEKALLAIDAFPRAALILSVFERMSIEDAAVLLDASPDVVRKARAIGLEELTGNLARMPGGTSTAAKPRAISGETQYA